MKFQKLFETFKTNRGNRVKQGVKPLFQGQKAEQGNRVQGVQGNRVNPKNRTGYSRKRYRAETENRTGIKDKS